MLAFFFKFIFVFKMVSLGEKTTYLDLGLKNTPFWDNGSFLGGPFVAGRDF